MPRKGKRKQRCQKLSRCVEYQKKRKLERLQDDVREESNEAIKTRERLEYLVETRWKRVQGEIICKGEMKQVLRLYFHLVLKEHEEPGYAAQHVSGALGMSLPIVKSALDEFVQDRTIPERDGSRR